MPDSESAVVYVPDGDYEQAAARGLDYCSRHRYETIGIVRGDYDAALHMATTGVVQVIVVDERGHLPNDRAPRVEVVQEQARPNPDRVGQRGRLRRRPRPRWLN